MLLAIVVSYVLLPKYLYQKKYIPFIFFTILMISGSVLIEELVLERIFYYDTRFNRFPGLFYTLIGILPIATILVGFKFGWDAFRNKEELDKLQTVARESELQYLKSQINPHFLFNNLNNLYSHALENSKRTPDIILELSSLLRYMLYECKEPLVSVKKEIENLRNFVQIGEMQIENRGTVTFHESVAKDYQIAPLILVVFVENAFKHSAASQTENIKIDIDTQVSEEGVLHFTCTNTYHEDSSNTATGGGIGLENVLKRLNLIYPNAYSLEISDIHDIYHVSLKIDLTKYVAE